MPLPAPLLPVEASEAPGENFGLSEEEARQADFAWSAAMVSTLGLLFLVLSLFAGVAVPVLLALAMAYVLNPAVTYLGRWRLSRSLGTLAVFVAVGLLVTGAVLYLIPAFQAEAGKLPDLFRQASAELVPRLERAFGVSVPDLVRQRTAELGNEVSDLLQSAGPAAARLLASFAGNTARLLATVLGLLIVPVIGFFFLRDYPLLLQHAQDLLPRRTVGIITRRFSEVDQVLSGFVRGQLMVGAILAVLYSVGFAFARIDMAIAIGVVTGFGVLVPYVGPGAGLGLALLSTVLSWQGPWQLGLVVGTFVLAQGLEGMALTPRIVGDRVGLPAVVVILAVLAFGQVFGFVGVLLAVPTSAVLKVVLGVVIARYRKMRLYTGEQAP